MRNAEASKERILDAAFTEFAQHGIAGARVDRIAQAAGCNKNLIYIYFESKETLFATVLQKHLARVYEEIEFTPEDLPGYAVRAFEFALAHPDLMRLVTWFSLEQRVQNPEQRTAVRDEKIAALSKAQKTGHAASTFPPAFMLTAVMALATAWTATNPFGTLLDPDAHKRPAVLKRNIAEAVKRLAS